MARRAVGITVPSGTGRLRGWRVATEDQEEEEVYLANGKVMRGRWSEIAHTFRKLSEVPDQDSDANPPAVLETHVKQVLTRPGDPIPEAEWEAMTMWEASDLVAVFCCDECGMKRRVEAASAGRLQRMMVGQSPKCAWVNRQCNQPDNETTSLTIPREMEEGGGYRITSGGSGGGFGRSNVVANGQPSTKGVALATLPRRENGIQVRKLGSSSGRHFPASQCV